MKERLLKHRDGAIVRWTLNDPAHRNALDLDLVEELIAACTDAGADSTLRFIVLSGSGGAFCSGGNVAGFTEAIGRPWDEGHPDPLIAQSKRFGDLLHALSALPQVLIAAVEGPAVAGGLGLVCCADFVIAAPDAVFATPEVTLGIAPAQIAPFVWRRLGDAAARRLLLQGRKLNAIEAELLGLVDQVSEDLAVSVNALIDRLSRAAPGAVALTKRLLGELAGHAVLDVREPAARAFVASLRSPEAHEGLAAFMSKRPPRWAR
ncbi:MAG TPA: enoyl-CoA hydratase-related protein [Albitalea sp.]|uniref:enoyl-CoA hydratase/isomerase family protein n=1 Tax=Piscinibacter sp. TaxID=1903157 RepID=UPI002ED3641C